MPDEQGLLSEEEQAKLLSYLKGLSATAPSCEFCHTHTWGLLPHIVSPMPLGPITKWKVYYPHFAISCNKCGNTKFFNAIPSGIMQVPEMNESKKQEESEKKEEAKNG